jgi:hydroxymethylglutaryl-CoA synthase
MSAGIDRMAFYVPGFYLPLDVLADKRGVPRAKYRDGLNQELMAVPPPDEDVVTLAANAAFRVLEGEDRERVAAVIVGTEGGVDEAKSVAVYLHGLLGLPATCQAYEVKQACAAASLGLRQAVAHVRLAPRDKVLVVAADIARYEFGDPGEPTQGAGACAMLVSAQPRLLRLSPAVGVYTEEVMDFWRPPHRRTALVDGKLSVQMYLRALLGSWNHYRAQTGARLDDFAGLCCHLPFARMAEKAAKQLWRTENVDLTCPTSMTYSRVIGNSYTASLYIALCSLLETTPRDLSGRQVALYSYGSGCAGLFFTGELVAGYRQVLAAAGHQRMLAARQALSYADYVAYASYDLPEDGLAHETPRLNNGRVRLAGIEAYRRRYACRAAAVDHDWSGDLPRAAEPASAVSS